MDIVSEFKASNQLLRSLSKKEAGRIQGLLQTKTVDTLLLAELAAAVSESLFDEADKLSLLTEIANTSTEPDASVSTPAANPRRKSQNWSAVIHKLLPATVWNSMVDGSVDQMFAHLGRLGLRLPDEPTIRSMTIVSLWSHQGSALIGNMSPHMRLAHVRALKAVWIASGIAKLPAPEC